MVESLGDIFSREMKTDGKEYRADLRDEIIRGRSLLDT